MTHKNANEQKPILKFPITTLLLVIFIVAAVVFAYLGFSKAGDLRVAPVYVSAYLFASGIFWAGQFVIGVRSRERWQRIIAVIAILAAVFTVVMGIMFYQALSQIQMPEF